MSFRSKKPPGVPQLPQQPSPVEVMDIIDEISGSQTITVTGPDGKKRRVTQRLPRTPQEEAMLKEADELMAKALDNIQQLYRYDPASVVNYQPFIQTFAQINQERINDLAQIGNFADIAEKVNQFKDINSKLVSREFDRQSRMSEEVLAKRGLQNSTMAAEQRAAMAGERALAEQQASVNAEMYGDDMMQRRLARENELYRMREAGRLGRLEEAQTGYGLERQKYEDLERARQTAIAENQNILGAGRNIKGDELAKSQLALNYGNSAQNAAYQQNAVQSNRYANDLNRIQNQYAINMERFRATPATFGEKLTDIGLSKLGTSISKFGTG